jgi:hypothetical protein
MSNPQEQRGIDSTAEGNQRGIELANERAKYLIFVFGLRRQRSNLSVYRCRCADRKIASGLVYE